MTLAEFLLARIAEDEAAARAASPGPWTYGDIESVAGGSLYDPDVMIAGVHWDPEGEGPPVRRTRPAKEADANGHHIARWDPARVLAECEAKRQIVEMFAEEYTETRDGLRRQRMTEPEFWRVLDMERTLGFLALPYADHPDYRSEWRP